jgi:hypothetical protein
MIGLRGGAQAATPFPSLRIGLGCGQAPRADVFPVRRGEGNLFSSRSI